MAYKEFSQIRENQGCHIFAVYILYGYHCSRYRDCIVRSCACALVLQSLVLDPRCAIMAANARQDRRRRLDIKARKEEECTAMQVRY